MLYIWLGVILALIMIEIISINLTAICFAISALFSLISIDNTTHNYIIQVIIFLIGGVVLMIFVRPNVLNLIDDYKKKHKKEDNKKEEPENTKNDDKNVKVKSTPSKTKKTNKKVSKKNAK